jgi:hypothetical protein
MLVLLDLVLAAIWQCDSVVILRQVGARTNRGYGNRGWESGRGRFVFVLVAV